jgi:hypothetical protein
MSEKSPHDEPDDDVEGHRLLTPEQAQERAENARRERDERQRKAADSLGSDS